MAPQPAECSDAGNVFPVRVDAGEAGQLTAFLVVNRAKTNLRITK